jgi:hypothetical protein
VPESLLKHYYLRDSMSAKGSYYDNACALLAKGAMYPWCTLYQAGKI